MIFYFSFSSRNTRLKKEILVLVSKHEIERKNFSFSSRKTRFSFKFLNKSRCNILRKIKKLKVFFGKYQSRHKQQIKFSWILARIVLISILVLVSKSEIEDNKSRSRLNALWGSCNGEMALGIVHFQDHFKQKCHFHFLIHWVLLNPPL